MGAILLATPASALAVQGAVPIDQAAQDVANGTATPVETEEYQAAIDFTEIRTTVDPPSESYQIIGGNTYTTDPAYTELQNAVDNASPATDAAVGADFTDAAGPAGLDLFTGLAQAAPVLGIGTADYLVWKHDVSLIFGTDDAYSGVGSTQSLVLSTDGAKRIFYDCKGGSYNGSGHPTASWYYPSSSSLSASWIKAGLDDVPLNPYGEGSGALENANACAVPTQTGAYVLEEHVPQQGCCTAANWYTGGRAAGTGGTLGNGECPYAAGGPPPGILPAQPGVPSGSANSANVHWSLLDTGVWATCFSDQALQTWYGTIDSQLSYETPGKVAQGLPHPGGCPSGASTCHTATATSSSAWCVTATCLADVFSNGQHAALKQFIDNALGAPDAPNPPGLVQVPSSCVGASPAACKAALTQAGFTHVPTEVTLPPAGADLTKPAGAVVVTNPAGGTYVDPTTTTVELDENPNPLPLVIPAPLPGGETYTQYIARLQALGFTGTITNSFLDSTTLDPSLGPDDVVRTSPAVGSQVAATTNVTVESNPDSSTAIGGGVPVAPGPPGITVPRASTPCSVFPFGIPCWVAGQLGALVSTAATAPAFSLPLPSIACGSPPCSLNVDLGNVFGVDLSSVMAVVRPVLLFVSFIGLVIWLGGMAMGGSTGGGGTAEAEE